MQISPKSAFRRLTYWKSVEGFTLAELIVVMVIIGTLAAVAIPSFFSATQKATFQTRVNEIAILFETARTQALASELQQVDESNWKIPTGGYGVYLDEENQTATLFIDDYHVNCGSDDCAVNVNYADEDIAKRVIADGIYTAGGDSILSTIVINQPNYIALKEITGTKLAGGDSWNSLGNSNLTTIFTPPYAETFITADDNGENAVELIDFSVKFDLLTRNIFRKIEFNRITTTPQIIKGINEDF